MVTYDKHDAEQKQQDTKGYKQYNFFHMKLKTEKNNKLCCLRMLLDVVKKKSKETMITKVKIVVTSGWKTEA